MTQTNTISPVLRSWQRLSGSSAGRWWFARAVARRAPYVGTISPAFDELRPTLCRVSLRNRRAVRNHLGTVHAVATGNLCELAASMVTEVTIPYALRWIPRGMTIEYLRKAETDLTATARLDRSEWAGAENIAVPVVVHDRAGVEVARAVLTMYIAPRPASE